MTIRELKDKFSGKIYIDNVSETGKNDKIEYTALLNGSEFGTMEIGVKAITADADGLTIKTSLPEIVFTAWKKYNDRYSHCEGLLL